MQSIANSIGECIGSGIDFITNLNNLPIVIGMIIIFSLVMFLAKGTSHIIDTAFFLVLAFFVVSCLCGVLGINLDIAGILHSIVQFFADIFTGVRATA